MDKLTKQSYLLHSLLAEFRKDKINWMAKSISEEFNVPIDEALDKCSVLITGLFIHILHTLIIEKMESGEKLAKRFLNNIGKSDSDIEFIHETYGSLETDTKDKFRKDLVDHLGVPTEHPLSDYYYSRIYIAAESIIEMMNKEIDKVELKYGMFDYADERIDLNAIKINNGHIVVELNCPCGYQGVATYGKMDFKLLGKDREGFIYFQCPKCREHLQYDPIARKIKTRKGILGFLFGRFS